MYNLKKIKNITGLEMGMTGKWEVVRGICSNKIFYPWETGDMYSTNQLSKFTVLPYTVTKTMVEYK